MIKPVIIIGAGLSGLTSAYILKKHGISSLIIEARDRVGGRIVTERRDNFHCEMGATWLGPQHTVLLSIFDELEIPKFKQSYAGQSIVDYGAPHPPYFFESNPNDPPTYRLVKGSAVLIDRLLENACPELKLNKKVKSIRYSEGCLIIDADRDEYQCEFLISTIPPKLTARSIVFEPELNDEVIQRMDETHTWMSNSIKFAIQYKEAFWKNKNMSGCIMAPGGPIIEMYDHSTCANDGFGLMGFLNEGLREYSKEERKKIVLEFLSKFLGTEALDCIEYWDKDWSIDALTTTADFESPHQHPIYANKLFQKGYMNGRLIISGTETSTHYAGYMEGAVYAGIKSAQHIIQAKIGLE